MTAPVDQWRRMGRAWAEMCWHSIDRPHRTPILRALASLAPFGSVLEVGCNAGPNLRLIHERWPDVTLDGIEANGPAAAYVDEHLPWADVVHGDLRDRLPAVGSASRDVVLTCYCLAYIEPGQIADVLGQMLRIARIGLVLAEPMVDAGAAMPHAVGIPEWSHNYVALLEGLRLAVRTVDPPVERLNAVMTVRL